MLSVQVCPFCTSSSIKKSGTMIQSSIGMVPLLECGNDKCESKINGYEIAVLLMPMVNVSKFGKKHEPLA